MIYLQLFLSFLKVGAFSFGGGYAALPLIQDEIVTNHQWLTQQEFTDLITISQMTPGPIAINSATFVGNQIAGVPGGIVATLGSVLPSIILVTILAYVYMKYRNLDSLQYVLKALRPAVVAMIATAGMSILVTSFWGDKVVGVQTINIVAIAIFAICLILLFKTKWDPVVIMLLAGVLNVVVYLAQGLVF
ncbi:chromate transporter [Aerococcus sp. 150760007-1]|uniref:Chromate transporter n=1 Tax=Aerococcus urinaeequi TaxID=51665 RepID=A0ABR5ZZL7_9LACT|nr:MULTISPECIES: chromate transporter [Lactobacillales]KAF3301844.1 chromate transporter [Carnobacterium sp. PL26RED25]KAF3305815.1 chromate transporter [Carnobacterium sp. PL24RED07]MBA5747172.1 chromate transporter [Aerococcus urinaeequi]MBA5829912.1 chromate transporter [Aerococcus urinaeequi]MBA5860855.1 chromate transporter [Aerococcus urinaeequi]